MATPIKSLDLSDNEPIEGIVPGQPPTTYYLPKIEFELKLSFELERRPRSGMGPRAAGEKLLVAGNPSGSI